MGESWNASALQGRSVVLEHVERGGRHWDWMFESPATGTPGSPGAPGIPGSPGTAGSGGELVTFRCDRPSGQWAARGAWLLTALPGHRRVYLRREGPIGGGRGRVRRTDRGTLRALLCSGSRLLLDVRLIHFAGLVELRRCGPDRWRAAVARGRCVEAAGMGQ